MNKSCLNVHYILVTGSPAIARIRTLIETCSLPIHIVASGQEAVQAISSEALNVVVFNECLRDTTASQLLSEMDATGAFVAPVVVLQNPDGRCVAKLMKTTKASVVFEDDSNLELWSEITNAISAALKRQQMYAKRQMVQAAVDRCSNDEKDALRFLLLGLGPKQAARALGIASRTVHLRRNSLQKKFGVKNIMEIMWLLVEANLHQAFSSREET